MSKKNWLVLGLALGICAVILAVGLVLNRSALLPKTAAPLEGLLETQPAATAPADTVTPDPVQTPAETATATPDPVQTTAVTETAAPAEATEAPKGEQLYLVVTVGGTTYEPIPLDKDGEYTVIQKESGASNTIHVTESSVYMASASCSNQDCVKQGEVTAENRETRILGNMIVCLPNQVTLQLCTAQEVAQMISLGQ